MTCEVCGREGCRAAYFPGLFNETVTECLRLGYEREKATSNALAKQCNDMEAQREYNAQLVAERDAALAAARRAYQPICERICGDDGEHVTACIEVSAALAAPAAGEEKSNG